jgi:outer membrane murein-binding lipoprotein Lpp
MEVLFWAALGFLVVAALAGAAFVGVRAWRAWQAFVSVAAGLGAGVERIVAGAAELGAHGERTAARVQELTAAIERLERTRARTRVLLDAAADLGSVLRLVRAFVPR